VLQILLERGVFMEKMRMIEVILEKIKAASFDDYGKASLKMDDIGDGQMIVDILDDLKAGSPYALDFDLDAMTLTLYNQEDDIEGFKKRHPSPQKCK
jgi:hypothetical protein